MFRSLFQRSGVAVVSAKVSLPAESGRETAPAASPAPASSRHAPYELLEWVELMSVGADGRAAVRRISRGDADFPTAVCSLGLLVTASPGRWS